MANLLRRRVAKSLKQCVAHTARPAGAALALCILAASAGAAPDAAKDAGAPHRPPVAASPQPQADAARAGAALVQGDTLDMLFGRLAAARDEAEGEGAARRIEEQWARSGSPTADLLARRAAAAAMVGDTALGVELIDRVIAIRPDWAEAWKRRAILLSQMGDDERAATDLRKALQLEPRNYPALAALGALFLRRDDSRNALRVWRKALEINPWQADLKEQVTRLAPDVDGRDL